MKKLTLFFVVAFFTSNIVAQQRGEIYKDDHIGLRLDLVEKTTKYPCELKIPGQRSPILKEGNNYIVVNFTIETINNIHVIGFGGRDDEKSIIFDEKGEKHKLKIWNSGGLKYVDPDKGLTSPYEYTQGAKGIMVFEFCENENLKELEFVYYFKNSWDDKHTQKSKINIRMESNI